MRGIPANHQLIAAHLGYQGYPGGVVQLSKETAVVVFGTGTKLAGRAALDTAFDTVRIMMGIGFAIVSVFLIDVAAFFNTAGIVLGGGTVFGTVAGDTGFDTVQIMRA